MDEATFAKLYREVVSNAAQDLLQQGMILLQKMKQDQAGQRLLTDGDGPYRIPKFILCAIASSGRIEEQFSAIANTDAADAIELCKDIYLS